MSPWALAGEVGPGTVSLRVSDPEDMRMARLEERVDALTRVVRQSIGVDLEVAEAEQVAATPPSQQPKRSLR